MHYGFALEEVMFSVAFYMNYLCGGEINVSPNP
jgi:hypothetical protein